MTRRSKILIAVPVALVAVVALFAVVGFSERDGGGSSSARRRRPRSTASARPPRPRPAMGTDAGSAEKSVPGADGRRPQVAAAIPPPRRRRPTTSVRNGALTLVVPRGSLLRAVDRVTALTTGMGGYVVSSSIGSERPHPLAARSRAGLDGQSSSPADGGGPGRAVSDGPLRHRHRPRPRAPVRHGPRRFSSARRSAERLHVQ